MRLDAMLQRQDEDALLDQFAGGVEGDYGYSGEDE